METQLLDAGLFASMVRAGAANLGANRQIVNDLNVFPIPDGDTGDNMYMTIDSGAAELRDLGPDSLGDTAAQAAKGMLLGARGNSGVILSRIFAGIAHGLSGVEKADLPTFSRAFSRGVEEAYRAVSVPVEGTILTVYKEAVAFASGRLKADSSFESFFSDFLAELHSSLERTPELLNVLKEAGVVDSGGAGFIYIAEGMKNALTGAQSAVPAVSAPQSSAQGPDISLFTEDSELSFGYCTEFLLRLQRSKVDLETFDLDGLLDWLNRAGDSVVCFRDGSIVKVHVHTRTPGEILNYMQRFGEFLTLKIENMTLQHQETRIENRFTPPKRKPHKAYGIVTVASGSGIRDAFEELNADTILVFPNNSNVILTARQAADLYDKAQVRIVPTKTIGEGYSAISMLDTNLGDTDAIVAALEEVIRGVVTGLVAPASRAAQKDGVEIHPGDYIGFVGDRIYVDASDRAQALRALAEALDAGGYDVLLLVWGRDVPPAEAEAMEAALAKACPNTEVILLEGDQPIYDYIMVLE